MKVDFSMQLPEFGYRTAQQSGAARQTGAKQNVKDSEVDSKTTAEQSFEKRGTEVLKNVLAQHDISLKFGRDEDTEQIVVELIDSKTGDIVRQIPSEISIELGKLFEKIQGRFFSERV